MGTIDMITKIRELRELEALIEEAEREAEAIKDAIKAAMGFSEELTAGEYKVTWKNVKSSRIDTAAFKKAMPEAAAAFTRETVTRRFSIR